MLKTTLTALVITLGLSLGATPVWADEVIDCEVNPTDEACIVTTSEDDVMPISAPTDYPEQGAANPGDEVIVDETEVEEEAEPAMWPVYLSLGALGLAVLVFIVLNLFGGKRK